MSQDLPEVRPLLGDRRGCLVTLETLFNAVYAGDARAVAQARPLTRIVSAALQAHAFGRQSTVQARLYRQEVNAVAAARAAAKIRGADIEAKERAATVPPPTAPPTWEERIEQARAAARAGRGRPAATVGSPGRPRNEPETGDETGA